MASSIPIRLLALILIGMGGGLAHAADRGGLDSAFAARGLTEASFVKAGPTLQGAATGNDPRAFAAAVAWSGGAITANTIFTGQASWADFDGSVGWEIGLWRGRPETKLWSIPLIVRGSALTEAAAGAYNFHYLSAAKLLKKAYPKGPIFVRTGWEFNGDWMPWSAIGRADDYKRAFRQFVQSFRSVSDRFVFTWTANVGDVGMDPATAYPGDDVVDIVGMDFYWQPGDPKAASAAWSYTVSRQYGLRWLESFAAAHRKPSAYPEWGVRFDDSAPFILGAAAWFARHNVVYQSYWDSNGVYPGKLSDGRMPRAAKAYLSAFRRSGIAQGPAAHGPGGN